MHRLAIRFTILSLMIVLLAIGVSAAVIHQHRSVAPFRKHRTVTPYQSSIVFR